MTQSEVSMSTGQAEYNGVIRGCIEVLYLENLLEFFKHHVEGVVETDSSAAKGIISRLGANKRTKYFATKLFWMQKLVRDGVISVKKCLGTENESDIGTKPVDGRTLWKMMRKLGILLLSGAVKEAEASEIVKYDGRATGTVFIIEIKVEMIIAAFVLGVVLTLAVWCYCAWRGRRIQREGEDDMKRLKIDKVIFAANFGMVHCTRDCDALNKTTEFHEKEWCTHCKKKVIAGLRKLKTE